MHQKSLKRRYEISETELILTYDTYFKERKYLDKSMQFEKYSIKLVAARMTTLALVYLTFLLFAYLSAYIYRSVSTYCVQ